MAEARRLLEEGEATIVRSDRDVVHMRWMYLLSDGNVVPGPTGGVRVPVGLPYNEAMQLAADRVLGCG